MFFFFFSSRRRHTRFDCDWSSDVCSSDLRRVAELVERVAGIAASAARQLQRRRRLEGELVRSEEHTSELQSQSNLVCRLLLEIKKSATSSRRTTRQVWSTQTSITRPC